MKTSRLNLLDAMRDCYSNSKKKLIWSIAIAIPYAAFSIIGLWVSEKYVPWFIVLTLALQLTSFQLKVSSSSQYLLAEGIRRAAMLATGLGCEPPREDKCRLAARVGVSNASPHLDVEGYYASKSSRGPKRLIEIIEESAFWTEDLSEWTANLFRALWLVGVFLVILSICVCLSIGFSSEHNRLAGASILWLLNIVFASDAAATETRYRQLSTAAGRILERCCRLKPRLESDALCQAMIILDEYNCTLASAPVLPAIAYNRRSLLLNKAWQTRYGL